MAKRAAKITAHRKNGGRQSPRIIYKSKFLVSANFHISTNLKILKLPLWKRGVRGDLKVIAISNALFFLTLFKSPCFAILAFPLFQRGSFSRKKTQDLIILPQTLFCLQTRLVYLHSTVGPGGYSRPPASKPRISASPRTWDKYNALLLCNHAPGRC